MTTKNAVQVTTKPVTGTHISQNSNWSDKNVQGLHDTLPVSQTRFFQMNLFGKIISSSQTPYGD